MIKQACVKIRTKCFILLHHATEKPLDFTTLDLTYITAPPIRLVLSELDLETDKKLNTFINLNLEFKIMSMYDKHFCHEMLLNTV